MVLPEQTAGEIQVDLLDAEDGLLGFHMADMVVGIQDGDSEPEEDLIASATYAFRTASGGLGSSPGSSGHVHTLWDHDLRAQQPDRMQRAHDKVATWADATSTSYHGSRSPGAHRISSCRWVSSTAGASPSARPCTNPDLAAECRQLQCAQPFKQQLEAHPEHVAWPGSADSH
jgi:hypothetical protein